MNKFIATCTDCKGNFLARMDSNSKEFLEEAYFNNLFPNEFILIKTISCELLERRLEAVLKFLSKKNKGRYLYLPLL